MTESQGPMREKLTKCLFIFKWHQFGDREHIPKEGSPKCSAYAGPVKMNSRAATTRHFGALCWSGFPLRGGYR